MAKVTFEKGEVSKARESGSLLLVFAVAGGPCKGFPTQGYLPGSVSITAEQAKKAIQWFEAMMVEGMPGTTPPGAGTSGGK